MDSFTEFLETASISGLNHISSTRKWARLFWITIVIVGFVMSSLLIWESFESWADNPVRTTTRTVPMKEMKFPKLTVCPPKNTFTDINYDLMLAETVTLNNETKNQLYEFIVAMIDKHVYMDPWDKLHEENRFYNWYNGFTSMLKEPHYHITSPPQLHEFEILTSATSGVISTQYFGESFDPRLVENNQAYSIKVYPAQSIRYNENITLHIKLEKLSLPLSVGHDAIVLSDKNESKQSGFKTEGLAVNLLEKTYTPPTSQNSLDHKLIKTKRMVSDYQISEANLKQMPGFRLSWYYTGLDFQPDPLHDTQTNKDFIREIFLDAIAFVNINLSVNKIFGHNRKKSVYVI